MITHRILGSAGGVGDGGAAAHLVRVLFLSELGDDDSAAVVLPRSSREAMLAACDAILADEKAFDAQRENALAVVDVVAVSALGLYEVCHAATERLARVRADLLETHGHSAVVRMHAAELFALEGVVRGAVEAADAKVNEVVL